MILKRMAGSWLLMGMCFLTWGRADLASAYQQINPALEGCRNGQASMCQRLGYTYQTAKMMSKVLKKKEKGIAEIKKNHYPEEVLMAIAIVSKYPEVGRAALKDMKTPKQIGKVILDGLEPAIRNEALAKLDDQPILSSIAINHKESGVRIQAVEKITSQIALVEVVKMCRYRETWEAALKKLKDQSALKELPVGLDADKSLAAIGLISDSRALADIALSSKSTQIRQAAVGRISDDENLARVVDKSAFSDTRMLALARIKNQEMLGTIAASSDSPEMQKAAMERITEDPALLKVIRTGKRSEIRLAAFAKLRDKSGLAELLPDVADEAIAVAAVGQTNDQAKLTKLAQSAISSKVEWSALKRLAQLSPSQKLADIPPKTITNSLGMTFIWIEPVKFLMGDDGGDSSEEKPAHAVILSEGYYLQTTEVTQAQWEAVMGKNAGPVKNPDLPVVNVSWEGIVEFMTKLNLKEKDTRYRLPTEAEWECACRAGGAEPNVKEETTAIAWLKQNSDKEIHPVGQKKPNAWGLFDMHGNANEWTSSGYVTGYKNVSTFDPKGPDNSIHTVRGTDINWDSKSNKTRCSYRSGGNTYVRSADRGFRCAKSW